MHSIHVVFYIKLWLVSIHFITILKYEDEDQKLRKLCYFFKSIRFQALKINVHTVTYGFCCVKSAVFLPVCPSYFGGLLLSNPGPLCPLSRGFSSIAQISLCKTITSPTELEFFFLASLILDFYPRPTIP